jgi:hypothetical protein
MKTILITLALCASAFAQPTSTIPSGTARRIIRGATLPSTCQISDVFYKTGTGAGTYVGHGSPCAWVLAAGASAGIGGTLTTVGAIPRVSAAGTLGESGLMDDGTQFYDATSRKFGFGTATPIGKAQTVISATNPFIVGGATVGSYTSVTFPTANKDYVNKTGIGTASTAGDLLIVTGGTGAYTGMYTVATIIGANSVQVNRAIHASGTDIVDGAVSISTAPNLAVGPGRTYMSALLNKASGNEVAFRYDYTTNKATSGNDTGLQINMTDSLSPGTSLPFQVNVGGYSLFDLANTGAMTLYNSTPTTGSTTLTVRAGAGQSTANLIENKSTAGVVLSAFNSIGNLYIGSGAGLTSAALRLGATSVAGFTSLNWDSAIDLALSRTSAGLLQINSGTAGKWAGLDTGLINMKSLATPSTPVITQGGTGGVVAYGYKVTALLADGTTSTAASAEGTTATGNATLGAVNYNIITITAVTGATSYDVYRITGGATQGKIGNSTALTFNDTGLAASGAAPTVNSTGSLLWATDGGGSIGEVVDKRPFRIYVSSSIYAGATIYTAGGLQATGSYTIGWQGKTSLLSSGNGFLNITNNAGTGAITRLSLGPETASFAALATSSINGFAIQSAAGTLTWNDPTTAASGTVASRRIFDIDTPTLTATNASVTYTTAATLHLGVPTASTNVTITAGGAYSLIADGVIKALDVVPTGKLYGGVTADPSHTGACTLGEVKFSETFVYYCFATDHWVHGELHHY